MQDVEYYKYTYTNEIKAVSIMKKYMPYILASLLIIFSIICASYIRSNKNTIAFEPISGQTASISFRVINGVNNQPIQSVRVIIPESGGVFYTNKSGLTPVITVPLLVNSHYAQILPQTWGEISVLAYKKNYADYALFHCQVRATQPRGPIEILLFPKNDNTVFGLIESPDSKWLAELLEKYRKVTS